MSTDDLLIFAAGQKSINIPCALPSKNSCSSINWSMGDRPLFGTEVVKAGKVQITKNGKYRIQKDCSLEIAHVLSGDAQLYTCSDGVGNATTSLRFPESRSISFLLPSIFWIPPSWNMTAIPLFVKLKSSQEMQRRDWSFSVTLTHVQDLNPAVSTQMYTSGGRLWTTRL